MNEVGTFEFLAALDVLGCLSILNKLSYKYRLFYLLVYTSIICLHCACRLEYLSHLFLLLRRQVKLYKPKSLGHAENTNRVQVPAGQNQT